MNVKQLLSAASAAFLGLTSFGQVDCQDGYTFPVVDELIMSEVSVVSRADYESTGNSRNTYIELYNGTGSQIDLSDYCMIYSRNSSGWGDREGDTLFLSGTLANQDLYVVTRDFGDGETTTTFPTDKRDVTWAGLTPRDGDDGIGLFKIDDSQQVTTYTLIDVFGKEDRPAEAFPLCGVAEGSHEVVARRKQDITSPNPDWDVSSAQATCEWESYALGEYENVKLPTGCVPPTTGTSVVYSTEFSVYQSNGQLVIESSAPQAIRISDVNGVTISEISVESGKNLTNVNLENGIYVFTSETSAPIKTMIK